jgi:hypothetical protein
VAERLDRAGEHAGERAGERVLLRAEQEPLRDALGQCGAAHRDERSAAARPGLVVEARRELLAGAGLAMEEQHVTVRVAPDLRVRARELGSDHVLAVRRRVAAPIREQREQRVAEPQDEIAAPAHLAGDPLTVHERTIAALEVPDQPRPALPGHDRMIARHPLITHFVDPATFGDPAPQLRRRMERQRHRLCAERHHHDGGHRTALLRGARYIIDTLHPHLAHDTAAGRRTQPLPIALSGSIAECGTRS